MKSESATREENLADLRKIIIIIKYIEVKFDQIIANTEAAHEARKDAAVVV